MVFTFPLLEFAYADEKPYRFDFAPIELIPFDQTRIPDSTLFSEYDRLTMKSASCLWALRVDSNDATQCEIQVNTLMVLMRAQHDDITPIIKYRLCDDGHHNARICPMARNPNRPKFYEVFDLTKLSMVDRTCGSLLRSEKTADTPRIKNAFFFLFRSYHSIKWVESFLLLMCVLESLFSNESKGGATKAITYRVPRFLSDFYVCDEATMKNLYDVRSKIAHGKIQADNESENLDRLYKLEMIVNKCIQKLFADSLLPEFETSSRRTKYLENL